MDILHLKQKLLFDHPRNTCIVDGTQHQHNVSYDLHIFIKTFDTMNQTNLVKSTTLIALLVPSINNLIVRPRCKKHRLAKILHTKVYPPDFLSSG
ncbi:hypothetical protein MTR_5g029450 [Medicago truncatula]|uniref:Uncharacterized protein n=1 Tax=Medicago truncatula TaxID=3880 RepID=G7KCD6_MEDTR|nr:hypothetical protein MTR_5g029450 [Medicago truncatula]